MLFLLLWFIENPELWLVEVRVPALSKLLSITNRCLRNLFLRRIVIEDLFRFLLCLDESFDFVEDVLIDIHCRLFLLPPMRWCRISRNGAALRLLEKLFSLHLIHNRWYACSRFSESAQGFNLQILLLWIFSSVCRRIHNSASSCLLLICSWLCFFRVENRIYSKEGSVLLTLNWGCAGNWRQSLRHHTLCCRLSVVRILLFGPRLSLWG